MKIALFSDIHANLPALESFFADVEHRNVDAIYCLGDLIGYNVWPNEVIQEIRARKIATLEGNHDEYISNMAKSSGQIDFESLNNGGISKAFTNQLLTDENRSYLQSLPAHIRLEFKFNDEHINLLFVHGSPKAINEYIFEERSDQDLIEMMEDAHADVLCFGHTHKPFHRIVATQNDGVPKFKHAINIGSVGKPKDHNTKGCYTLLEFDSRLSMGNQNSLNVESVRFDYDIEKAAMAVIESELPDAFAENLRNGY
ncbi:MAG: metallophosphoesterase family protein [Flavobacteriaceae bacterium]